MDRLGIVDLGSNTARLVVFGYKPGTWYRLLGQIREPIRLGEGMGLAGQGASRSGKSSTSAASGPGLTAPAIDRAVAALRLFADYQASTGLDDLSVFATSAVREAANRARFLRRLRPLDLDFEILSGEQEALLSVQAVANGFTMTDAWVVDLGGGSAQISLMESRECARGDSFPLGAVRLTESFLSSDPPSGRQIDALEEEIERRLGKVAKQMRRNPLPLVAMGGTVRNLARAAQKLADYPLDFLHGYWLSRGALESVVDTLLSKKVGKRARIPGIKPDRADIVIAGALVYRWLLRATHQRGLTISGHGLREGIFLSRFLPPPHRFEDVRQFSVQNLVYQYPQPRSHLNRVRKLANRIFRALAPLHHLDSRAEELLDVAGSLHDIGMAIGYHRHHRHGAYLLTTAALPGFTHREQALLALLVRYHRKGFPSLAPFERLTESGDKRLVLQLSTCLRLAEQLERSRAGRVREIEIDIQDDAVTLTAISTEPPMIELSEAAKHQFLFERAFGRRLLLGHGPVGGAP